MYRKSPLVRVGLVLTMLHAVLPVSALAAGPEAKKVLVLEPQSDTVGKPEKDAGLAALRDGLAKYPGVVVLDTPKVDLLDVMMELECTDMDDDCFTKIGAKYGADQVLATDVAPAGGGFEVKTRLIDVKAKKTVGTFTNKAAGKTELTASIGAGLGSAFGPPPAPEKPKEPEKPVVPEKFPIDFASTPPGATISLNNVKVGVTPISVKLKPGKYKATVVLEGYEQIEGREIEVKSTGTNSAIFDLKAIAAAEPVVHDPIVTAPVEPPGETDDGSTPYYKQWWFWTAIGVAVVGTTVGLAVGLNQGDDAAPSGAFRFGFSSPDYDPAVQGANQ